MAGLIRVRSIASGFQYSAFIGCKRVKGEVAEGTATTIKGGWAATKEAARQKAHDALAE